MSRVKRGLLLVAVLSLLTPATAAVVDAVPRTAAAATPTADSTVLERSCDRTSRFSCLAVQRRQLRPLAVSPNATPRGYGPAELRSAYRLDSSLGAGRTVAIVNAYDDPAAESDLGVYRAQFGLPACTTANGCFRKINQNGGTSPLPLGHTGWAGETSLDLQMASAVCPNCKLLLVEANDANMNMFTAVKQAVSQGAKFVSMSWGGVEDGTEPQIDATYFDQPGVAFVAASGDDGFNAGVTYPSTSRYVTGVGGTSLTRTYDLGRGWAESAWAGSGSGCSTAVAAPAFQAGFTPCGVHRASADVAAVADPATGVAVYYSYGGPGWTVFGGTSVAAPIVAGVYALGGLPGAGDRPVTYPYTRPGVLFDVTTGATGQCGTVLCRSQAGWDGPTGLGSPNGSGAFRYLCVGIRTVRGSTAIGQRPPPIDPNTPRCP